MIHHFGIKLRNEVSNHVAIVRYFIARGYRVETIQYIGDSRTNLDTGKPYGGWKVGVSGVNDDQMVMDRLSGKLDNLDAAIMEFKEGMTF